MRILLVHGWACDATIWSKMTERLRELLADENDDLEIVASDLGFFDSPFAPQGHFDLAVGHSMGLLWLLTNNTITYDRLVSINGFTRFVPDDNFSAGWSPRIVQQMRKQLAREPEQVVSDFLGKCERGEGGNDDASGPDGKLPAQLSLETKTLDVERLNWGLEALINQDGREQWSQFPGPRCVIAATADAIVNVEHTNSCFLNQDIQWLKTESHLLPLKFPEICAALIRELIEVS